MEKRANAIFQMLLSSPPKLHGPEESPTDGWRLDDVSLAFINVHVHEQMRTIETGAGVSTILFALKRTRHTCIVPDPLVVHRIRHYCAAADVSVRDIEFIVQRSEYALPLLPKASCDFALIDGRHGFPAPFIDWFYIADRLQPGGLLLLDDTWIWTCEMLAQFLDADPRWRRSETLPNSAVFLKEYGDAQHAEWVDQPFVYHRSPAARYYPASGVMTHPSRDVIATPESCPRETGDISRAHPARSTRGPAPLAVVDVKAGVRCPPPGDQP